MREDKLMSIFLSLKEIIDYLIKSIFILDNGEFYFDNYRGLKFLRDLFDVFLGEILTKNKIENSWEFFIMVN